MQSGQVEGAIREATADFRFIVDSREKRPYSLSGAIVRKLDVGDYSVEGFEEIASVERKSFEDLYSCLTVKQVGFRKQLAHLSKLKHKLLILDTTASALMLGNVFSPVPGPEALSRLVRLTVKAKVPFCFADRHGADITSAFLYYCWKEEIGS